MSPLKRLDIIIEIYELCHELIQEVGQQLLYFRASVYKNETAELIRQKIEMLRSLVELIPDEMLTEPFLDYEAELKNMVASIPGECTFSMRVSRLLQNLENSLRDFKDGQINSAHWDVESTHSFEKKIFRNRKKILAVCRPGTRRWNFFQSL